MRGSLRRRVEARRSGSRSLTLENLDSALCDLDGASSHGFLQTFWFSKVHVREALALIDLDLVKRAEHF
jgi:hypothetical protein